MFSNYYNNCLPPLVRWPVSLSRSVISTKVYKWTTRRHGIHSRSKNLSQLKTFSWNLLCQAHNSTTMHNTNACHKTVLDLLVTVSFRTLAWLSAAHTGAGPVETYSRGWQYQSLFKPTFSRPSPSSQLILVLPSPISISLLFLGLSLR